MWRTQTKFNIAKFTQLHSRRSTYFRWLVPDNIFRKLVFVDFFLLCHRTRISFPNYLVTFISTLISQLILPYGYFRRNFELNKNCMVPDLRDFEVLTSNWWSNFCLSNTLF